MNRTGVIYGINGPVVYIKGNTGFKMAEMVYVGKEKLVGEVIGLDKDRTTIQVFEETTGIKPGEIVELEKRKALADAQIREAEKAKADADAIKTEYEQNMKEAKEKANEILTTAQRTAALQSEEVLKEAASQAAALKSKAESDIAQEKRKAVNEIKDEIGGMAVEIAGKVIEREISEEDHTKLIDEFIANVGEAS